MAAAMKRGRDDDEEAAEDGLAAGGPPPSQSARVDDVGGKGGSRKGKGKGKADRECFLCGQKGHFKAHCPNRWYVPKTQWSSWWNTLPFQKGKAKGKGKDQGEGGKSKGKGKDQFFYKGQGKGVGALEYPGAVSNVKTRCSVSGVLPVEKVPIRIMHKKNTAVKRQPTMKDVSKMHTTAEDTHEVEKDETNMDREKKDVENLFAEKGWTVKVSRNRMRRPKVAKVLRSGRCDCCTSQSSRIISELRQKKVERSEKLANMVRRNSDTVKLITGLTVKQDALAPCAEKMSEWTKLSLAVDSGACESVIDAAEQVPVVEADGVWPEGLLDACIAMIPKVDGDATPLGQRPLCVLPVVYRVWASARMMQLEPWFLVLVKVEVLWKLGSLLRWILKSVWLVVLRMMCISLLLMWSSPLTLLIVVFWIGF